jgi:hypothetical protein
VASILAVGKVREFVVVLGVAVVGLSRTGSEEVSTVARAGKGAARSKLCWETVVAAMAETKRRVALRYLKAMTNF